MFQNVSWHTLGFWYESNIILKFLCEFLCNIFHPTSFIPILLLIGKMMVGLTLDGQVSKWRQKLIALFPFPDSFCGNIANRQIITLPSNWR